MRKIMADDTSIALAILVSLAILSGLFIAGYYVISFAIFVGLVIAGYCLYALAEDQ